MVVVDVERKRNRERDTEYLSCIIFFSSLYPDPAPSAALLPQFKT